MMKINSYEECVDRINYLLDNGFKLKNITNKLIEVNEKEKRLNMKCV